MHIYYTHTHIHMIIHYMDIVNTYIVYNMQLCKNVEDNLPQNQSPSRCSIST